MPFFVSSAVFRRYVLHIGLLWRSAPLLSLVCLLLALIGAGAGTAALVTTGQLVGSLPGAVDGGLGSAAAWEASTWLAATAVLFVLVPVASAVLAAVSQVVSARYLVVVLDLIMEVGTRPHGIAHLEDPRSAGELTAVAREPQDWLFIAGVQAGWTFLSIRLGGIGAFAIVAGWSWLAAFSLVVTWLLLSKSYSQWNNTIFDNRLEATGNDRRRAAYLRSLLTGVPSAKEVRIFGLTDWLIGRYASAWRSAMWPVWAKRARGLYVTLAVLVAPLAANTAVILFLARDARVGALGGGAVVMLAQAMLAMSAFGPQQDPQLFLARTLAVVTELARLRRGQGLFPLRSEASSPAQSSSHRQPRGERVREPASIELRDVSFTYPSEDRATLSKLSLEIPAGQSVALVGANGVGKSTLIKLLCGLYRPEHGTVRIDGADSGVDEYARRRVAVVFQDFVRYHLSLRDNVGVGACSIDDDQRHFDDALTRAAADSVLARLEHGWDTILSPEYAGGTELSGGQWQRVALARALAALDAGAGVLVLDEPTSALDVRVEAALFDRFLDVTRGVTTLLVSHRLSSVRHVDRIVVLGPGADGGAHVVEDGSHDELMAHGGVYAGLFSLQASRFAHGTVS